MPEAREAQFVVERPCPWNAGEWRPEDVALMPLCLWVSLAEGPACQCGGVSYRVTRAEGATEDGRAVIAHSPPAGHYMAVCEHMGHLIE